jgi:hypothetical protein
MFKIVVFFMITLFALLYVRFVILLTRRKCLQDRIISKRGEIWAHKTRLTPPLFIDNL